VPLSLSLQLRDFYVPGAVTNVELPTSWTEIAGSAALVGRDVSWPVAGVMPDVLVAERVWRALMIHTTLQGSGKETKLWPQRTTAFESLDGSEKGAISFFLGQAVAKHVAEKLFGCIVFAHMDAALRAVGLPVEGTRPDFVGLRADGSTVMVEAKGRSSSSATVLENAKAQLEALPPMISVGVRYASLAYFTPRGRLKVTLKDPDGQDQDQTHIDPRPAIASYYDRLARLAEGRSPVRTNDDPDDVSFEVELPGTGITLRISSRALQDAAALATRDLSLEEFAQRLVQRHRRQADGSEAAQTTWSSPVRDIARPSPATRREVFAEMTRVSRRAEAAGAIRHADGTVVLVDARWSADVMRAAPERRG
jgi:hypothetical protein